MMTGKNSGLYFLLLGQLKGSKTSLIGKPIQISKEIGQHFLRSISSSSHPKAKVGSNSSSSSSNKKTNANCSFNSKSQEDEDDKEFPSFPHNFSDNDNEDLLSFLFRHEKSNNNTTNKTEDGDCNDVNESSNHLINMFKTTTTTAVASSKLHDETIPEAATRRGNKSKTKRRRTGSSSTSKRKAKKTKKKMAESPSVSDDDDDQDYDADVYYSNNDQHVTFALDVDDQNRDQEEEQEESDDRPRKVGNIHTKTGVPIDDPTLSMPENSLCRCNSCRTKNKKR